MDDQRDNRRDVKRFDYDNGGVFYRNTVREWAAYLASRTQKPWTADVLENFLQFLSLEQILGATSDYRRTPEELVAERDRRLKRERDIAILGDRIAKYGRGYIPRGHDPITEAEVYEMLEHGELGRATPPAQQDRQSYDGLPQNLTPSQLETIREMQYLILD